MNRAIWITNSVFLSLLALPFAQAEPQQKSPLYTLPTLTIGSKAPTLAIEHWISDGHPSYDEVDSFTPGRIYVVEFWATWCGPCVASMPHLAEIQKEFGPQGVQVIGISDEPLETIDAFLAQPIGDVENAPTYRELTAAYHLTSDPDRSVRRDYMEAGGQRGIPSSYVIGKTGLIEWIGHPMTIDEPLQEIVSGNWDREAFRRKHDVVVRETAFRTAFAKLSAQQQFDRAETLVDELFADDPAKAKERRKLVKQHRLVAEICGAEGETQLATLTAYVDDDSVTPRDKDTVARLLYLSHRREPLPDPILEKIAETFSSTLERLPNPSQAATLMVVAQIRQDLRQSERAKTALRKAMPLATEYQKKSITLKLEQLNASGQGK